MARDDGWGQDIREILRNGDWNYAAFLPDGAPRPRINHAECLACHRAQDEANYMFTHKELTGAAAGSRQIMKTDSRWAQASRELQSAFRAGGAAPPCPTFPIGLDIRHQMPRASRRPPPRRLPPAGFHFRRSQRLDQRCVELAMMARGVPTGASMPVQVVEAAPG